jgi:hypothetical protein
MGPTFLLDMAKKILGRGAVFIFSSLGKGQLTKN